MKKLLLILFAAASVSVHAQTKEGRMVYERTIQTPVRMFNADPEIARQLPKSRTEQFELLFSGNQSLWQYLPSANNEDPGTFSAPGMVVRFGGGANEISYQNFDKQIRVDQREVMERSFVVTDSIRKLDWKLSQETKKVMNYTAYKATAKRIGTRPRMTMENGEMKREEVADTTSVIAWFTTEIPVPAGPDFQGQLPGMILELDVNNGQTVYKAIEFSPKVAVAKIKEPKEGKRVTANEFQKERDKLMEQMRKNMPAGNVIRMN
jgi:GLPGLI family protein